LYRSRETLKLYAKRAWIESGRLLWAKTFDINAIRSIHFFNLVWFAGDLIFRNWIYDSAIQQITKKTNYTFELHGPNYPVSSTAEVLEISSGIWYQSAIQMDRICKANKIPYFHFLQPNQYDPRPDIKPFTPEERAQFILPKQPYAEGAILGYPVLVKLGKKLKSAKVPFYDLGFVFKDSKNTLYNDDCCHLNSEGNLILGAAIGDSISRDWVYQ
jgi:hypothetical protein